MDDTAVRYRRDVVYRCTGRSLSVSTRTRTSRRPICSPDVTVSSTIPNTRSEHLYRTILAVLSFTLPRRNRALYYRPPILELTRKLSLARISSSANKASGYVWSSGILTCFSAAHSKYIYNTNHIITKGLKKILSILFLK